MNSRPARGRRGGLDLNPAMKQNVSAAPNAGETNRRADLPVIEIRFPATYAWLLMGIGGLFFLLGLWVALLASHGSVGAGLLISAASVAAIVGGEYWRRHLHVVAQLSPQQLILRRDGPVYWTDITAIEVKTIRASYRGTPTRSDFVCIKLKSPPAPKGKLDAFMRKAKRAISGYDIIVGGTDLSCTPDWFVAECRKRMAAAGAPRPAPENRVAA
jgi:hypothetical protein